MPFRLWLYLTKAACFILMPVAFATFFAREESLLGHVQSIAMGILFVLGLIGAFMGILFAFGKLRMSCPFCGKSGRVGANKQDGLWMECRSCGFVHGSGALGLTIVCEELGDEESDDDED